MTDAATGFEIAVIGMSCHVPGASTVEQFWDNLREGRESIRQFSEAELVASGVPPELLHRARLRPGRRRPRRRRALRRRVLRLPAARGAADRPAAAAVPGVRLGGARARRLRPRSRTRVDRRLRRDRAPARTSSPCSPTRDLWQQASAQPDRAATTGLPGHPRRLQARPHAGPRSRPDRLLDARSWPCTWPARACSPGECDIALAGGRLRRGAPERGLPLRGGRDPLAGRALPHLRRRGRAARCAAAAWASWCCKRLADALARRRPDPGRHQGLGHEQRRRAQGRATPRPERRGPGRGRSRRRSRSPASSPTSVSYVEAHGTGDRARRPDRGAQRSREAFRRPARHGERSARSAR